MKRISVVVLFFLMNPVVLLGADYPLTFTDSTGEEITFTRKPVRVVSLVPSVTEMLMRIGASESVVGLTHHSVLPPETAGKRVVGGFFRPDMEKVVTLEPDAVFHAGMHEEAVAGFRGKIPLINLSTHNLADSDEHLRLLGRMFDQEDAAEKIIAEQHRLLALIADKTAVIEDGKKQRVMRLMGRDSIMTPGDDSFQNEYIRAAGAVPPRLGKKGAVVPVSLEEWKAFNPQFLYGCGGDRDVLKILEQPGWRDVDAVKNGSYAFYPCDLTCRASTRTGYFVAWLAANIYRDEFSDPALQVLPEKVVERSPLTLDLEYVKKAEVVKADIRDFRNKSVVIGFDRPMKVVSTLEGQRDGILHIGNHYFPPPAWGLGHMQSLAQFKQHNLGVLGLPEETTSFLFTGADMDNLAVVKKRFKDMEVTALVTAGVAGNAVRMAQDVGMYYEPDHLNPHTRPGTINILLLSNMQLSPRAMTRAIISATEAKSAALQDLDIRSSYTSSFNPATGTGTDNVLVVEGAGIPIDASGGHTKMGELIARAVYDGVREAVHKQNGFTEERTIFQRLKERKTSIREIGSRYGGSAENTSLAQQLEKLMLDPAYSSFIEAALAISDDYERELVKDLNGYDIWCRAVAKELAGKDVQPVEIENQQMPVVLRKAFGALIAGLQVREQ